MFDKRNTAFVFKENTFFISEDDYESLDFLFYKSSLYSDMRTFQQSDILDFTQQTSNLTTPAFPVGHPPALLQTADIVFFTHIYTFALLCVRTI